jgi:hypothetical protein
VLYLENEQASGTLNNAPANDLQGVEMMNIVVDDRDAPEDPLLSRASSWRSDDPPVIGKLGAKDGAVQADLTSVAAGMYVSMSDSS